MANEFIIKNGYHSHGNSEITGSLIVTNGITGSLFGTSSWAENAQTSSYVLNAVSASYSTTSSYAQSGNGTFSGSFSGSITAPGSTTQVVYNNGGVLGANSGFVYSGSSVGIGTTSPSAKLQIASPASGVTMYVGRYLGQSSIKAGPDADGGYLALDASGSGATIINHYTPNNIWMVTGGGSVGIGTSSPSAKLHISASGTTNDLLVGTNKLFVSSSGNVGIGTTSPVGNVNIIPTNTIAGSNLANAGLLIGSPSAGIGIDTNEIYNSGSNLIIGTIGSNSIVFSPNSTPRMYISSDGNVGIGTTTPSHILHISGSSAQASLLLVERASSANANIQYKNNTSAMWAGLAPTTTNTYFGVGPNQDLSTAPFAISSSGNVGIGTTTPGYKLDVVGQTRSTYDGDALILYGNTRDCRINFDIANFAYATINARNKVDSTSRDLALQTDGGNVGIGTTSPSAKLHISSSGTTNDLLVGTNKLFVSSSGNVGIGTSSPSAKLHVVDISSSMNFLDLSGNSVLYTTNSSTSGTSLVGSANDIGVGVGVYSYGTTSSTTIFGIPASGSGFIGSFSNLNNIFIGTNQKFPVIVGSNNMDVLKVEEGIVTIKDILSLNVRTTNPTTPPTGSIIVSGSGANVKPYFFNGTSWVSMI